MSPLPDEPPLRDPPAADSPAVAGAVSELRRSLAPLAAGLAEVLDVLCSQARLGPAERTAAGR